MAEYLTNMNAVNLLRALEDARHITPADRRDLGKAIQSRSQEKELPIYLRVLAGVGAFIASLCILGFLTISKIIRFDEAFELLTWAGVFIASGILLVRGAARGAGIALHSFLMQWSFCFVGLGKIMAVAGATEFAVQNTLRSSHADVWFATFALAAVTAVTWPFYRMSIDRFVSASAVLLMLLFDIWTDNELTQVKGLLLDGMLATELCFAALLFTSGRITRSLAPLGYALAVGLSAIVFVVSMPPRDFLFGYQNEILSPSFANAALSGALIALIGWAAGGLHRLKQEQLLVGALGAVLLGLLGASGVILSIGFMVLGYARHDRKLISSGALLAPVFIWLYYYNLDLSLMAKSATLVGSGLLLLAGRGYMRLRHLDKEI